MSMQSAARVSRGLQDMARKLNRDLERLSGERVAFSLFVWTPEFSNYVSSAADREQVIKVLEKHIANWRDNPPDEWPAEPWVVSGPGEIPPDEIGSIFQEGELDVIVQVDPNHENPDAYVQATARRIVACVNAMAGIEDPEAFRAQATPFRSHEAEGA